MVSGKPSSLEQSTPIDIYYNKLLDWLIDRRHCNSKWREPVSFVQVKINAALKDMPPNEEISRLLCGTYINYFHCQKIVELLKECGEGNTNFFGQYSSQRMKDWQEIILMYEKDNIYLAEAAHTLQRNVNYELPALKGEIGKSQQIQRECARKEIECSHNASVFKEKFHHTCKQMGIEGGNIRTEFLQLVEQLPEIFDGIAEKSKLIDDVVDYYREFAKFITERKDLLDDDITPLLKFVICNGNATVYQWKTGEAPTKIIKKETVEAVNLEAMAALASSPSDLVTDGYNASDDGGIDFGDESETIDFGNDEIDFGDGVIDFGETESIDFGDNAIDFGATLSTESSCITIVESGEENPDGAVAVGTEADSIFENSATRNLFIDELLEIEAFLEQRLMELSIDADMVTVHQFQSAPRILQMTTRESLQQYLGHVSSLIADLTSTKMQNLYLLKSSPRYVERLTDSLQQKLKLSKNMQEQVTRLREKADAALAIQSQTEPKYAALAKKTKILQNQVASEISRRYKERIVNIMGEINTI